MPLPYAQTVAAGVLINAGTRDERWPKEAGIAHALEHMHLQGTKNLPTNRDVTAFIEEVGGVINAWTWKEMTFYFSQVPRVHRERAFTILSEQLRLSIFPEAKIPVEMKNIVQEIRRRNDNPKGLLLDIAADFLYKGHPLGKDTLGLEKSVTNFSRENFLEFKKRLYDPANYVFIVAGNITPDEARLLFETNFPEKHRLQKNERIAEPIETNAEKQRFQTKDIQQVHVIIGATTGPAREKHSKSLDLFETALSGGMSFPLFQEVRDKLGLCYEVWASSWAWSDVGAFGVYVGTDPKRYEKAVETVQVVLEKTKNDEAQLARAKNTQLGRIALKFENPVSIINSAAVDIAMTGEPRGYDEITRGIESIGIADVARAVDTYLSRDKLKTIMLVPHSLKME